MRLKMKNAVCFAGHREEWHCVGIENILEETIENLINQDYKTFFDGNKGAYDNLCSTIIKKFKCKYPDIKLIPVLSSYNPNIKCAKKNSCYDETIYPNLEEVYPKQRIIERNKWIIDNSTILIAHILYTTKSGAYKMVKYAQKKGLKIIFI